MDANRLSVVFMGTPEFAVPVLAALDDSPLIDVVLVVTRPDAASGRGKALLPSPVRRCAQERGLAVLPTKTLRTPEVQLELQRAAADLFCVAAFGAIIPPEVLAMPRLGSLNVHASLLPRGRGAAPMQRALLEGQPELGWSIMQVEEGLDTGAYCRQGTVEVGELVYDEVAAEVSRAGAAALVEVLEGYARGEEPSWTEQDEALATHADKITKAEVLLDPSATAADNMHRIQASGDAAPARCQVAGRGLRVCRGHVLTPDEAGGLASRGTRLPAAGEVVVSAGRVLLGCADGVLEAVEVKPDGKRQMLAREFAAGLQGADRAWGAI